MLNKEKLIDFLKTLKTDRKYDKKILYDLTGQFLPPANFQSIEVTRCFNELGYNIDYLCSSKNNFNMDLFNFNANKFIYIKTFFNLGKYFLPTIFFIIKNIKNIFNYNKLFEMEIGNIYIGDLIVDEYIRRSYNHTVIKMDKKLFLTITKAIYHYFFYKNLFKKHNYDYIVVTANFYTQLGLLNRYAVSKNIKILQYRALDILRKMNTIEDVYYYELKPNKKLFYSFIKNKDNIDKSKKFVNDRLLGKGGGWDDSQFKNARVKTKEDDLSKFNKLYQDGKKIVVIASSVLMDSVLGNYGKAQVFKDNYLWLVNTLKFCASNPNIITYLKPHPAEKGYKTIGALDVLKEVGLENKILIWPKFVDTLDAVEYVHLMITPRGSLAREYPCFGTNVLVHGEGAYSGYDTVIEPKNVDEYKEVILSAHKLSPKLNEATINSAFVIYYLYNKMRYPLSEECYMNTNDDLYKNYSSKHYLGENIDIKKDLRDDVFDILIQKIKKFDNLCKDEYINDLKKFLNSDDELHFGEKKSLNL